MTLDHNRPWHLQLLGRPMDGGPLLGRPQPLGDRLFLLPGTFTDEGTGLGLTNHALIPLPSRLFRSPWLLAGYELWDQPEGGSPAAQLQIAQPLPLHEQRLEAIPPCSIQMAAANQPAFAVSTLARNPCPGWSERIHLYQSAGKPFEATSVVYIDKEGRIAAVELFHVLLRPMGRDVDYQEARRCWVQYTY
jgi:hypothetical protein